MADFDVVRGSSYEAVLHEPDGANFGRAQSLSGKRKTRRGVGVGSL
jgi:hypothetical protein